MNAYKIICEYCNFSWEVNYVTKDRIFCTVCNDPNLRIIDLASTKIDYYQGCPPFPKDKPDTTDWGF